MSLIYHQSPNSFSTLIHKKISPSAPTQYCFRSEKKATGIPGIASVCTLLSVVPVIPTVVKPFDVSLSTWVLQDTITIKKIVQLIFGYTNEPDL